MPKKKISFEQDQALAAGRSIARGNQRRRTAANQAADKAREERERALRDHLHGWKNWEYDFSDMTETRVCRYPGCGATETRKIRI